MNSSDLRALARGDSMARFRRPARGAVCPRCTRRDQTNRCAICSPPPLWLLASEILRGVRVRSGLTQLWNRLLNVLEEAAGRAEVNWPAGFRAVVVPDRRPA